MTPEGHRRGRRSPAPRRAAVGRASWHCAGHVQMRAPMADVGAIAVARPFDHDLDVGWSVQCRMTGWSRYGAGRMSSCRPQLAIAHVVVDYGAAPMSSYRQVRQIVASSGVMRKCHRWSRPHSGKLSFQEGLIPGKSHPGSLIPGDLERRGPMRMLHILATAQFDGARRNPLGRTSLARRRDRDAS